MESKYQNFREVFPFIRQVIQDAYRTETILYTHPYQDLRKIDRGFRNMIWGDVKRPELFTEFLAQEPCYRMAVLKSTLGYYNIFASVSLERHHPDFISIGPFCDEHLSKAFVQKIVSNRKLTAEQTAMAEKFYEILPCADMNDVTLLTLHLLCAFIPEYRDVMPEYVDYSEEKHEFRPVQEAFWHFTDASAECYAAYLKEFLDTLITGDEKKTFDQLKVFLDANGTTKNVPMYSMKKKMHELNSFCKEKLLSTSIHPYYILRQADTLEMQIDACVKQEQLVSMPYKMVRRYCLIVRNYTHAEYSYLIRRVIAYIEQHLDEELSLSSLAKHFQKNPSFLSGEFRRETGKSLTEYIHYVRIQEGVRLFNTTDMSVSEAASRVGFSDFGWFSKLFQRQVGMSPREYKKMLNTR